MKLTLWQQFSSNHSGFFWVVGTFEKIEDARHAFSEIRSMLFDIEHWHQENVDNREVGDVDPFPPEEDYAAKYNIEWEMAIDWWGQNDTETLIDEALSIVGRNVIIQNPDETWNTTNPFREILASLGAKTIGYDLDTIEYGDEPFEAHTRCSFTAPNAETADRLESTLKTYIAGISLSPLNPPPWNDDEANFARVLPTSSLLNAEHIDLLKKRWQRKYDSLSRHPSPLARRMPAERIALSQHNIQIRRDGLNFTLDDLRFYNEALGMSAFIAWLEVNHCTAIDFKYLRELD